MRRKKLTAVPNRQRTVRVLVVDDHALFAEALMFTLGIEDRIEVVGWAKDGVEAVSLAESLQPDVVLMDVHMPCMDGIEATRRVREVSPRSWVTIVTSARSAELASHAKLIDSILELGQTSTVVPFPLHRRDEARTA
ncbi:MAG: response regulator transcription factor [Actinobacteria bacterium]|nr:MAG: response regulator transcription factor [Actinomycetota bacterium]